MKRFLEVVALMIALLLGLVVGSPAKPEDTKKTGKVCVYCHTKVGSKELNAKGKYHKEHGKLLAEEKK